MNTENYKDQLVQLLPPGKFWNVLIVPGNTFVDLLTAFADEFARVDVRASDLLDEADPRTSSEMLADWERITGLPDECTGAVGTEQERRNVVVAKLVSRGGQSINYFIGLLEALGFTATIEELHPHTCETGCDYPIYEEEAWFVFRVSVPGVVEQQKKDLIECTINKLKPAHVTAIFSYT